MDEGHEWVVDLDLEKFFDRVNRIRCTSPVLVGVIGGDHDCPHE
jgi:hypothetical protein